MFRILFVFFIIVPIIEIAVIMQVGALLGAWPTVAIVVLTAWIGAKKVREQGMATLTSVQTKMAQGQLPNDEIIAGLMLLVAGILLVTPGFVTDAFGIALLFPKIRLLLARSVKQRMKVTQSNTSPLFTASHFQQKNNEQVTDNHRGQTIEGEFERKK